MRIALGLLMQETHSFSPLLTGIEEFRHSPLVPLSTGVEMIDSHRHAESEMGGFIKACEEEGVEMVPLLATFAVTSGPVTSEAFAWLQAMLLDQLQAAGELDGVLVAQHGAMAVQGNDDPEGEILASIRGLLPGIPVGCSLDVHGILTRRMVDHASVLVCYETHTDYREIGERTARLLMRCIREGLEPIHYLRKLPMVLGRHSGLLEHKQCIEDEDEDVLTVSLFACNPWTDVTEFGPAVLLTAKRPDPRFEVVCDELARRYWEARIRSGSPSMPMDQAIAAVLENTIGQGPVILQDCCDIIGGGAIGSDVTTLTKLLAAGGESVAAIIYDPEAVDRAYELGLGAKATFAIGGKIGEGGAPPLAFDGAVAQLYDGELELIGTPYGGLKTCLGAVAIISRGEIDIIVTSKRIYPQPTALLSTLGIDGSAKQGILCKDVCDAHAMEVSEVINVDTPGLTIWDFAKIPYRKAGRPLFPLDDIAEPF